MERQALIAATFQQTDAHTALSPVSSSLCLFFAPLQALVVGLELGAVGLQLPHLGLQCLQLLLHLRQGQRGRRASSDEGRSKLRSVPKQAPNNAQVSGPYVWPAGSPPCQACQGAALLPAD